MFRHDIIRVAAAALVLSTLSFAAGVAGDLSEIEPPRSGERVILRIPPELPPDTVRARPLAPRLTSHAAAAEVPRRPRQLRGAPAVIEPPPEVIRAMAKPPVRRIFAEAKPDPDRAPKPETA